VHFGVGYLGNSHPPAAPDPFALEVADGEALLGVGVIDGVNLSLVVADGDASVAATVGVAL
jgi:hypothetical protein